MPSQHHGLESGQSSSNAHSSHRERAIKRRQMGFGGAHSTPQRPQFLTSPNGKSAHVPLQQIAAFAGQSALDAHSTHVSFRHSGACAAQSPSVAHLTHVPL